METLETLSDALNTTSDIQSIVRTMKSLSAVSIRQFERAEAALADFEQTIELGLTALLHDRRARGMPLPWSGASHSGRSALIVIGSDRGLCGRYNETITGFAQARLAKDDTLLGIIGLRAAARLETNGHKADTLFSLPGSVGGLTGVVQSVVVQIDEWMRTCGVDHVVLVHNRREGRNNAKPTARQLLPLPPADLHRLDSAPWPTHGLPFFRMDAEGLLSWLVQQRLFTVLYQALAQALSSEHATRLAAMQSAERNIEDRRDDLNSAYRQKRQETITRELMDVISGFEAVGGQD